MSAGNWKDLYAAASAGDLELVRFHVASGVDVNHVHPEYQCTVLVAAILGRHETVALELLDLGAHPQQLSELDGLTPLAAAREMRLDAVTSRLASTIPPGAVSQEA